MILKKDEKMVETKILDKADTNAILVAGAAVGGAALGIGVNQTLLLNKGSAATAVGALSTAAGVGACAMKHNLAGAAALGFGLPNLFLGLYDMATGNM